MPAILAFPMFVRSFKVHFCQRGRPTYTQKLYWKVTCHVRQQIHQPYRGHQKQIDLPHQLPLLLRGPRYCPIGAKVILDLR